MKKRNFLYLLQLITIITCLSIYLTYKINESCSPGQYFDTTKLDCNVCPTSMVPGTDGKKKNLFYLGVSCTCPLGSIINANITSNNLILGSSQLPSCTPCPANYTSSLDRSRCIGCPQGVDPTTKECICPAGNAVLEKNTYGQYFVVKQCLPCIDGTYPGPSAPVYSCKACSDNKIYDTTKTPWSCACNLTNFIIAGPSCVPIQDSQFITTNYPINIAKSLTFGFQETIDKTVDGTLTIASSDTIDYLYLNSAYNCLKSTTISQSCQVLANLCVLQMYDSNNPICKLYNYINGMKTPMPNSDLGRKMEMPWLYYQSSADQVLNNTSKIPFQVSFDPKDKVNINLLQFYIAKYDIFGSYHGMNLLTTELELCSNSFDDGKQFRSFGDTIKNSCNIDLSKWVNQNNTMYFYEMFLMDPTSNTLIDIPIMIDNIPNPKASGTVGQMNNSTSPVDWILTRRFFLIDNLSAIQGVGGFISGGSPIAVRFPKLIKLVVLLQNTPQANIMVPYFEIFYKSKSSDFIQTNPSTYITFVSEYRMNIDGFVGAMTGIFAALNVIVGIVVAIKMYIWYKLNPPALSPDNYSLWLVWTAIFKLFQFWGVTMFWFCLGISAYWYIFFKLQYRVFLLLPPLGSWLEYYRPFDTVFGIACSAYTFYICYKVADQTNIDIFFIDWEHEKEILVKNATELRTEKYRGAWRILQVANQFNELQKKRSISLNFSFLWLVFFWGYLHWDQSVSSTPSTEYIPNSPNNYVLQHFLSTFVLIMCGIGHLVVVKIFQLWVPLKKQEFIDLCCVSNISVFILDQSLHGYYIHGQSPAGKADTNLDELLIFLDEEGSGRVRGRGLVEKDNQDLQSYEIFISYKMRTMYDGLYGLQSETMILSAQNRDKLANQSRIVNLLRHLPKTLQIDKIYKLKTYMNSELKEKIQKVSSQPAKYIREKNNLQRFLNYPPLELIGDTADDIVCYKDPNLNFDDCLISGIEWDWFIWNVFMFQMWQLTIGNLYISVYLTFICDQIMFKARTFFGEKNLARKAIIDNKFFN